MKKKMTIRIGNVVKQYKAEDGSDKLSAVRDILTELLHYCDKNDIDFKQRLEGAMAVFEEESETNLSFFLM